MATNSVEICNSALTLIGTRKIVALSDPSVEARECNSNYDKCRKATLRDHPWNFATKRKVLTTSAVTNATNNAGLIQITSATHGRTTGDSVAIQQVQGTNEANGTWTVTVIDANNFTLQGSTFTNTYVSGGVWALAPEFGFSFKFAIPTDFIRVHTIFDSSGVKMGAATYRVEGGYILTDQGTLWLKYVYDLQTTTTFDPLFDLALAANLAAMIAFKITGSEADAQRCKVTYDEQMQKAKFTDSVEDPSEIFDDDEWIRARQGRGDWIRDPMTN
jgi:hypothetical protein